eukprot:6837463-Ditylum_brightwellii.AAC.1
MKSFRFMLPTSWEGTETYLEYWLVAIYSNICWNHPHSIELQEFHNNIAQHRSFTSAPMPHAAMPYQQQGTPNLSPAAV